MHRSRPYAIAAACLLLAGTATSQSNVRPLPNLVRLPEMGAELIGRGPFRSSLSGSNGGRFAPSYEELRDVPVRQERETFTHFELAGGFYDASGFEGGPGDVAVQRGSWQGIFGQRIGDEAVQLVSLRAEASFYDFSGATGLVPGVADPFNDVYETGLGFLVVGDPHRDHSWFAGFELTLGGEDEVDLRDSVSVGGAGGWRYVAGDDLTMSFGIAARSRLEDDPWLIPYLLFDWRIDERWRLRSEGTAVELSAQVSDTLEVTAGAELFLRQYRLNDDNPLPDGVVQNEEIDASLGLRWQPNDKLAVELEGGVLVWREFRSLDDSGAKLTEIETDPAAFAALSIQLGL